MMTTSRLRANLACAIVLALSVASMGSIGGFAHSGVIASHAWGLGAQISPDVSVPDSSVTVSLSISPQQVNLGNQINVQATANGGTPPYSFSYVGLPSGCNSSNQPSFVCNPSSSGTFNVQVTATDSHGNQSTPSNTVTIDVTSSNNGGGNGNGGSNNSSNPFSSLLSGLGGFFAIALILAIVGFVTWLLLVVGVWVIAVVLMRRLPKRGREEGAVATVKCAACSATIPAGTKFCPQCGASTAAKGS